MSATKVGDRWLDERHEYTVVTGQGAPEESQRSGLSHSEAMTLAEEIRRDGGVAIVMHVLGDKSYEVDRYPAR